MTDIVERLRRPEILLYQYAASVSDDGALLHEAADEIEQLREAVQKMLDAVCGDFGFAAAVRADSGKAYPWHPLEKAEKIARAALGGKESG